MAMLAFVALASHADPMALNEVPSLEQVQELALASDPYRQGSQAREQSLRQESNAADTWDNPVLTTSIQNVPVDSFSASQEAMTQFKVGVQQSLPRGESQVIAAKRFDVAADKEFVLRALRNARVIRQTSIAWYDGFFAQRRLSLLTQKIEKMQQVIAAKEASFASASEDDSQQSVLDLSIQLVAVEEELAQVEQRRASAYARLHEWLNIPFTSYPKWPEQNTNMLVSQASEWLNRTENIDVTGLIAKHPLVKALSVDETLAQQDLAFATEQSKPKWTVEASYGYRHHDDMGHDRADFLSIGVRVDLPSLTPTRHRAQAKSAAYKLSAAAIDRRLEIKRLSAEFAKVRNQLVFAVKRHHLIRQRMLSTTEALAQTALRGFEQDTADIADVLLAGIAAIDAKLKLNEINAEMATYFQHGQFYLLPDSYSAVSQVARPSQLSRQHSSPSNGQLAHRADVKE
ncbi:hypothetical protein EP12_15090 [Alteromonas australica]|nr:MULTISPECIES: TolC family protein [Alteromonas]AJP44771.1 hypothetical protein EP12_15090 [Alteromonas australica]QPL50946.1 TolC family protein [Alteromonas sp. B31-7]|tara:strand:- start:1575 stop:2951 length:1377 start_codon:yes stop_codon:yes gene_type:complete